MWKLLAVLALLSVLVSVKSWGGVTSRRASVRRQGIVSMKIFDWKARDAFADYEIPAGTPFLAFIFSGNDWNCA